MNEFITYHSRWRIALLVVGGFAFVVAGLWMAGLFGHIPETRRLPASIVQVIGWLGVSFFGVLSVLWIKRLSDRSEQLRIGAAGIYHAGWSAPIPWSDIADIRTWGSNVIILHLHRKGPARHRGGPGGLLDRANLKMTEGDVWLSLAGTTGTLPEALAAIRGFNA